MSPQNSSEEDNRDDVTNEEETRPEGEDLNDLVQELRAELTRLKAQQAKVRAQNWVQRHPFLTVLLSAGVGAAAGYGASVAARPRAPRTLSEHARDRLRRLTDDARQAASELREEIGTRAARSGAQLRERAERTGRQVASQAQEAGRSAQREAGDVAKTASDRLREVTDEAAKRLRNRGSEAAEEAKEFSEQLGEQATEAVGDYTEAVSDSVSEATTSKNGRSLTGTVLALAGMAAGSYLASRVRQWF